MRNSEATATQTTEYVGRRRAGERAAGSNYVGVHQYEAPRPTEAETAARVAYLLSLPSKW